MGSGGLEFIVKREEESAETQSSPGQAALIYVCVGLLATALLMGVKYLVEHSAWGQEAELWAFAKLQGSLSKIDTDNPIVLLDISDLPGGKVGEPTSRKKLEEIIGALAEQQPMAIAVDVDFSPERNMFATEDDPDFFDFCLGIKREKKIPIFLAVGKNKSAPPDAWLGQEEYKELAVAVAANKDDTSRLPLWVRAKEDREDAKLKTMSYALALEYRKHLPEAPEWINWAVDKNIEGTHAESLHEGAQPDESVLVYADRLVNYSKLDALKLAAQKDTSAQSVRDTGSRYTGRLVILGDVSAPADFFPIPDRKLNEGGCLLHASATYTLIKEPLFELKSWVRLLLDFLIAAFIILMVAVIRYRNPADPKGLSKQAIFIYAAIVGVLIAGWLLVRMSGVMWLDFLFVAFALFLHPKVEHWINKILVRLKKRRAGGPPSGPPEEEPPPSEAEAPLAPAAPEGVKAALCLLAAVLVWSATARAQEPASRLCQQRVAAVALGFHLKGKKGTCSWRENKKASWQKLTAEDAERKSFRAGYQLQCDKGCSLVLLLCGTGEHYPVKQNPPKWYSVLNAYASPTWLDRFKDIPARRAQLYRPDNPSPSNYQDSARTPSFIISELYGGGARVRRRRSMSPPRPPRESTDSKGVKTAADDRYADSKYKDRHDDARAGVGDRAGSRGDRAASASAGGRDAAGIAGSSNANTSAGERQGGVILAAPAAIKPPDTAARDEQLAAERARQELNQKLASLVDTGNKMRVGGDFSAAERAYKEAAQLAPDDPDASYGLGNVYADQLRWKEAEEAYRRALQLGPRSPETHLALGFVLLQPREDGVSAERLAQAEVILLRAAMLQPGNDMPYVLLDAALEKRGASAEEVERVYRAAVDFNPQSVSANLRLSGLLRRSGRKGEANEYLRAAERSARLPEDMQKVAETMESLKRYGRAERLLRDAVTREAANNPRTLYALGSMLMLRKRYAEASSVLELAAGLDPDYFAPRYLLGMARLRSGKLAEAELAFDEAAAKAAEGGDERLAVAYSLASVGDALKASHRTSDAVRLYEKALRYDPDDAETAEKLSEARSLLKP